MYINLMFIFILGLNWITTTPSCCAFTSSVSKPIITNLYSFSSAERNRNELSGSHSSLSAVTNLSPNKANSLKREQVSKATSWGKNRFGHTIRNSYTARSSVKGKYFVFDLNEAKLYFLIYMLFEQRFQN